MAPSHVDDPNAPFSLTQAGPLGRLLHKRGGTSGNSLIKPIFIEPYHTPSGTPKTELLECGASPEGAHSLVAATGMQTVKIPSALYKCKDRESSRGDLR